MTVLTEHGQTSAKNHNRLLPEAIQRISDSSVVITTQSPQRIPWYRDNCLI